MQRDIKVFLIGVLALIAGYSAYQLNLSLKQTRLLKIQISQIQKEKEHFQEELKKSEQMIESLKESLEVKTKLAFEEQAKAKNLETQLLKTKEDLNKLTAELDLIRKEKLNTEISLEATLKKPKEIKRSKQLPLRKKIAQLTKSLSSKDKEFAELKKRLDTSEKTYLVLAESNKSLAEGAKDLESIRLKLFNELQDARSQLLNQTERLNEQIRNFEQVNMANQEFRKQITVFSEVLVRRELDLVSREKEVEELKRRVTELDSKRADLESRLSIAKAEQAKTIRLLTEVAQLNAALEEKLGSFLQTPDEKGKAEELKRKVEVILSPQKP